MIQKITTDQFNERVYNLKSEDQFAFLGKKPVVLDFYADWCGPCKVVSPILDELSIEYADQVDFYKINVDEEEALSSAFNIASIPTFYFIKKGETPRIVKGLLTKNVFSAYIDSMLEQ